MKHLMIDLETLDIKPTSVVLSIGAVIFDTKNGVSEEFILNLDVQPQIDEGRTVSFSTINWWLNQNKEAKEVFAYCDTSHCTIHHVAEALGMMIDTAEPKQDLLVWANHIDFDLSILADMHQKSGLQLPWSHRQQRDFATIRPIYKDDISIEVPASRLAHNALEDARWQAEWLRNFFKAYPNLER